MGDREHLLTELDSLDNRQHAIHIERASLDVEEALLLDRKLLINKALGELVIIFGYGANGEYM